MFRIVRPNVPRFDLITILILQVPLVYNTSLFSSGFWRWLASLLWMKEGVMFDWESMGAQNINKLCVVM